MGFSNAASGSGLAPFYNQIHTINYEVRGVTGGTTYTAKLEVFDQKTKKPFGILELSLTVHSKNSVENKWKWNNDNGVFTWMQWGMILYSEGTNPPSYVWSVVNQRWHLGNAVELPRIPPPAWFRCDDTITVGNESRGIIYGAKPISELKCCKL
jgi:hypothetical protein